MAFPLFLIGAPFVTTASHFLLTISPSKHTISMLSVPGGAFSSPGLKEARRKQVDIRPSCHGARGVGEAGGGGERDTDAALGPVPQTVEEARDRGEEDQSSEGASQ